MIRVIVCWVAVSLKQHACADTKDIVRTEDSVLFFANNAESALLQPDCRKLCPQGATAYVQDVKEATELPSCFPLAVLACKLLVSGKSESLEWSLALCCTSSEANGGSAVSAALRWCTSPSVSDGQRGQLCDPPVHVCCSHPCP